MIKTRQRSLFVGAAGALLCLLGAVAARQQFFISYLCAYLFWFGIAVGSFGILMMHHVTGGAWGDLIRPQLNAAAMTLPFLGLLFIPILLGISTLFPWARPDLVSADALLRHKHLYLNIPFFALRAAGYFILWSVMAYRLNRWSLRSDFAGPALARRRSAPGLVVYSLTLSFAVLDWMMSLEPHWYSTIYEAMVIIGQMLSAFAFVTFGLRCLQNQPPDQGTQSVKPYWDLGNMLLAFVMFWAYMSFSQYLIIWSGNLPVEIAWYLPRQRGGWFWMAMALIVFQFIMPFLILLGRRNKQRLDRLVWVAITILGMAVICNYWLIQPAFFPGRLHVHWLDLAAFAALGGFWLAIFITQLQKQPAPVGSYAREATP